MKRAAIIKIPNVVQESITGGKMCILRNRTLVSLFLFLFSLPSWAVQINYSDFSDVSTLTLNGDASQVGAVLRVAPAEPIKAGSAFITKPVDLSVHDGSFSSSFSFQITGSGGDDAGADGLTFTMQSNGPTALGGWGGPMGYSGSLPGFPQYGDAIRNSVIVEFDTFYNGNTTPSNNDFYLNHVGINLDGDWNSKTQRAVNGGTFKNGSIYNVWIDYLGISDLLEVRISSTNSKPTNSFLSYVVDIPSVLGGTSAFMGFTAATGGGYGNHDILNWSIKTPASVPEPSTLLLTALGLLAGIGYKRK